MEGNWDNLDPLYKATSFSPVSVFLEFFRYLVIGDNIKDGLSMRLKARLSKQFFDQESQNLCTNEYVPIQFPNKQIDFHCKCKYPKLPLSKKGLETSNVPRVDYFPVGVNLFCFGLNVSCVNYPSLLSCFLHAFGLSLSFS